MGACVAPNRKDIHRTVWPQDFTLCEQHPVFGTPNSVWKAKKRRRDAHGRGCQTAVRLPDVSSAVQRSACCKTTHCKRHTAAALHRGVEKVAALLIFCWYSWASISCSVRPVVRCRRLLWPRWCSRSSPSASPETCSSPFPLWSVPGTWWRHRDGTIEMPAGSAHTRRIAPADGDGRDRISKAGTYQL